MTESYIDDFEHSVTRRIEAHEQRADFPKLESYGISKNELSDYLFEKQSILDSGLSQKGRYTVWGILIVLPVAVIDCFPHSTLKWGNMALFIALAIGLLLCLIESALERVYKQWRLFRQCDEKIEKYIKEVLKFPLS